MASTEMLANAKQVVDEARAAGATIIHAPISFAAGYNEITEHPYGILAGVVDNKAFVKGTWGADIVDDLAPRPMTSSSRASAARHVRQHEPRLHPAQQGIKTVALGGFLTNCCVESTMRRAYEKGYDVVTLTDCVAATSQPEHDNAIPYDYPMFSRPMTSEEFTSSLQGTEMARTSWGARGVTENGGAGPGRRHATRWPTVCSRHDRQTPSLPPNSSPGRIGSLHRRHG